MPKLVSRAIVFLAAMATTTTLLGCASGPIGVQRMNPQTVHRSLTANALTEDAPSVDTRNVLHRHNLYQHFRKSPASALDWLHRYAVSTDDDATWFALAELSFLHSQNSGDRGYALMAALYAWSYLFGGAPPEPFDPRLRVASDIYNRGLTEGLTVGDAPVVELGARDVALAIGQLHVRFDPRQLEWNERHLHSFVPVAELQVQGLNYRFRTAGIGAPLAASAAVDDPDASTSFLAPRLKIPVTALLRVDDIRRQIAAGKIDATLELHTDPNETSVRVGQTDVPLEKEPTAAFATMFAGLPIDLMELQAFLGSLTQSFGEGRLIALRPHVRGRIPVVFVHGTASSVARWAEMVNVLDNDPRISERFEPWFFSYTSSGPIAYSSSLLRQKLTDAVARLDPDGSDPGLREMVVVGHSQGGLLTKMTAVHSGNRFWGEVSDKPFDSLRMNDKNRELMRSILFVEPLPFVSRVVFICTPHRGSFLAAKGWVRRLITRLVTLPARVTLVTADLLTMNPDLAALSSLRGVNAVDNMSPNNRFVRVLSTVPVSPDVTAHSIVAVLGSGPPDGLNDSVVEYRSAHIDGVESEKIVHSSHSTQAVPETIEEVRRILLEHAAEHPAERPMDQQLAAIP